MNTALTKRILVIDDESSIGGFLADLFGVFNMEVDIALSGKEGLKMAIEGDYDLAFVDYSPGDITGADIYNEMKQHKLETPVVIMSGYLSDEMIRTLSNAGAKDYLFKPMAIDKILEYARKFIDPQGFNL